MIIIEGPLCVGKTTAAKNIADNLASLWYQYMAVPHSAVDYEKRYRRDAVQDQFHLGEIAYGALAKLQPSFYTLQGLLHTLDWVRTKCYVVVMYASDTGWYVDRWKEDGTLPYRKEDAWRICEAWRQVASDDLLFGRSLWNIRWDVATRGFPDDHTLHHWIRGHALHITSKELIG